MLELTKTKPTVEGYYLMHNFGTYPRRGVSVILVPWVLHIFADKKGVLRIDGSAFGMCRHRTVKEVSKKWWWFGPLDLPPGFATERAEKP